MATNRYFSILLLMVGIGINTVSAQTDLKSFIIGGQLATEGQFPWLADFRLHYTINGGIDLHSCGGTLIAPQWVLTAAHCLENQSAKVRLNSINTDGVLNPNGGVEVAVVQQIPHPSFDQNFNPLIHDIALLKLATPVTSIAPISMPTLSDTASAYVANSAVKIAGWGISDQGGGLNPATVLNWVTSGIYGSCETVYNEVFSGSFCVGYHAGETPSGAGQGDSGGPAWRELPNGTPQLLGICSGGASYITTADHPAIYTKVAYYQDWINSVITTTTANESAEIPAYSIELLLDDEQLIFNFGDMGTDKLTILLIDMNASTVISNEIVRPSFQSIKMDLRPLSRGIYAVRVITQEGKIFTKKIFKS